MATAFISRNRPMIIRGTPMNIETIANPRVLKPDESILFPETMATIGSSIPARIIKRALRLRLFITS